MQRMLKGTPLDAEPRRLSAARPKLSCSLIASWWKVLSYNLLAPAFVRPIDLRTGAVQPFAAFQWVKEAQLGKSWLLLGQEDLDWEARQKKILEQLRSWRADAARLRTVLHVAMKG